MITKNPSLVLKMQKRQVIIKSKVRELRVTLIALFRVSSTNQLLVTFLKT